MIIDLRSDTVTKPSKGMLEAMFSASVGDDVFSEDFSTKQLEEKVSSLFGMEAALFCPSGTMANQIAIKVHTQPGNEVICDELSHIYNYEGGGIAFNSGVSTRLLKGDRGRFTANDIEENINPSDNIHYPLSRLIVIENTSNKGGGCIWDFEEIKQIQKVCKKHNLKLHLDGARLFNALVETTQTPKDYGKIFDTISICLSKGLGAPIGTLLIGDHEMITKARRIRKVLGGGMRQTGYFAAAGIYALENNIQRLKEDHFRIKEVGKILESLSITETIFPIETNMVIFTVDKKITPENFIKTLNEKNIKFIQMDRNKIRAVAHLDFTDDMLTILLDIVTKLY